LPKAPNAKKDGSRINCGEISGDSGCIDPKAEIAESHGKDESQPRTETTPVDKTQRYEGEHA